MVIPVIVGLLTLGVSYKIMFKGPEDLFESIKYWLTPDIISMFRGEFHDDAWAELKLFFWLATGVISGFGAHQFLN